MYYLLIFCQTLARKNIATKTIWSVALIQRWTEKRILFFNSRSPTRYLPPVSPFSHSSFPVRKKLYLSPSSTETPKKLKISETEIENELPLLLQFWKLLDQICFEFYYVTSSMNRIPTIKIVQKSNTYSPTPTPPPTPYAFCSACLIWGVSWRERERENWRFVFLSTVVFQLD